MNQSVIYYYDKTFDGLLTAVFDLYERREMPSDLKPVQNAPQELWSEAVNIITDYAKADRVWNALVQKITEYRANRLFRVHFSGIEGVDFPLLKIIYKVFENGAGIFENYADPDVLLIKKAYRRVSNEAERVAQFIRFQKTADNIYFATCGPDFDVIPMVLEHFRHRFASQQWMIYDMKRKKGYYYNKNEIQWVTLQSDKIDSSSGDVDETILSSDEKLFQRLWKQYFRSICIDERINLKLHRQKVPKKYWKYLTEKKQGNNSRQIS